VSWSFIKREWGAITFVLTVLVGLVVVPVTLYLESQGPAPVVAATPTSSAASSASTASTPHP
jgi:hypothetical protein